MLIFYTTTVLTNVAIGIYISSATANILDEVFGKGAYKEILCTDGYIVGTSTNLVDAIKQFGAHRKVVAQLTCATKESHFNTKININELDNIIGGLK